MPRALPSLAALIASLLLLPSAFASESAHLVYVRAERAAACPGETELRQAVKERVGYDPFFPWAKTTVVVEVTSDGIQFAAHVQLVDNDNHSLGVRDLRSGAKGCAGLIDAAALAISIALELGAAPAVSEPEAQAPAAGGAEVSPPPAAPEPRSRPAAPTERDSLRPDMIHRPSLRGDAGVDVVTVIGEAPDVVAGFDLWLAARVERASLGVELRADTPSDVTFATGGRATIVFAAGTLAPCVHGGAFFACALGTFGWLHASGHDVALPRSGSAFALGVGPRAGIELALGGAFALTVHGDLLVNAIRPAVSLDRERWALPLFSGTAGAGIAYRFP
jgi:hypothetical protein